jgi:hypothetical protein
MRLSESLRSSTSSLLPVPLNSSKITSSMREPVSISAVAMRVSEPPFSMLRAEPKKRLGRGIATQKQDAFEPVRVAQHPSGDPLALQRQELAETVDSLRNFAVDHLLRRGRGSISHDQREEGVESIRRVPPLVAQGVREALPGGCDRLRQAFEFTVVACHSRMHNVLVFS